MTELETLTSRAAADLAASIEYWSGWNVRSLWIAAGAAAVTFFAAIAIVVTQKSINSETKQLDGVQHRIAEIKEAADRDVHSKLEKAASDALAAQQQVELDLNKQKEAAANAERSLLELQRRIAPRRITPEQKSRLVTLLKNGAKGDLYVQCASTAREATDFANEIRDILVAAGFETPGVGRIMSPDRVPGVAIVVHTAANAPAHAAAIQRAFFSVGIPLEGIESHIFGPGQVQIIVATSRIRTWRGFALTA